VAAAAASGSGSAAPLRFWAALAAALLGPGLALCACGAQSSPRSISTTEPATASTTAAVSTTVTTSTHTLVGTTPAGTTVTVSTVQLTTTPAGPDGVAIEPGLPLAPTSTTIQGQTIDGIQCNRLDQLAYQAYAHLQVYVSGHPRALPGAIGLVGARAASTGTTTTYSSGLCAYWVRTRAANGVIEIRSPVPETYTLGDLFDIWTEPLSSHEVAGVRGPVTARVNGKRWRGSPREIPLREHESIELAVGRPVPAFQPVNWAETEL
jgi:hypothetical protein